MNIRFAFRIAWRYLFSRKSHAAINNITLISVCGIALASMALVCAMAIFNGFSDLVVSQFTSFDPDYKISSVKGKSFSLDSIDIASLRQEPQIKALATVIEENALARHKETQIPVSIKGVSPEYLSVAPLTNNLIAGRFRLTDSIAHYANLGASLASFLELSPDFVHPFEIYAPVRGASSSITDFSKAFSSSNIYTGSTFSVGQPELDSKVIIVPYSFVQQLYGYANDATSIEIATTTPSDALQQHIQKIVGPAYKVENRHQQQAELFNMMKIEKWITFAILIFILIIASFNIISSLTMLIIEKKQDSQTLSYLGADRSLRTLIFGFEGALISLLGSLIGMSLGITLCLMQEHFGLLKLGEGFLVDNYPIRMDSADLLLILIIVTPISFITSLIPVLGFKREITTDNQ